ncbi:MULTISPECIES: hypothetical protein [Campylobacter]|uniref:Biopolymer transporter ExbB n=1 Tax=Campylobacter porcelli TaxID=1660073 RepID=A0A1X9SX73_9BACT|nr:MULTISPECIES: hypothetical protein [unclassified Campylobacter]MCR8678391.1 biopolymer transporter ExbB [Campylobacter sp. RM19072]MCR8695743.1 biopolymer transporter ExbB [Campylobacter sp. RM19073]MEE3704255.1 biopolymer transporter ExbB [Campylobacter sp. CX2-8023-23]MEE3743902.1 biopolymer transporter ExbB [Campylobacter sp. CX2-4855-23]MEE3776161.1 biopolymer transporter ExbB [Campylobacter sp. CX2-4080-23]
MRLFIFLTFTIIFSGCSIKSIDTQSTQNIQDINIRNQEAYQNHMKEYEYTLNLSKYIGKKSADCSALITTISVKNDDIYSLSDLSLYYSRDGRRSQAIYNLYKSKNQINHHLASPGDLIFFNNTTKSTRGKKSHNITHIGVVKKIKDDGTIVFLHNLKGKNVLSVMNLEYKDFHKVDGNKVNAYIIANCKSSSCLVSNRFSGFGKISKDIAVK